MIKVWKQYTSDLDRAYPMYALSVFQTNDVSTTFDIVELLPDFIKSQLIEINSACGVDGLTPRKLSLYTSDGANFLLNYPRPFTQDLIDYLTRNINVAAFELIGEKTKYSRLQRMLDNV